MLKRLGSQAQASSDPHIIEQASKLILPGVGSFDFGMTKLMESGLIDILNKKVLVDKTPILGICLGVQLMTKGSEEGSLPGLGWFNAKSVKFDLKGEDSRLKIPHMGWNDTLIKKESKLFNKDDEEYRYYYVHSYHLLAEDEQDILSTCRYGYEFVSGLEKENITGLQFHPEKSHKFGMRILKNFIEKT
jgi:glutamine amidotransferase